MINNIAFSDNMNSIMETMFTVWLNGIMKERGYNQTKLAKLAHLDQGAISRLCSGKTTPKIDTIKALSKALKVSAKTILYYLDLDIGEKSFDPQLEDLIYIYLNSTKEERERMVAAGRFEFERQQRENERLSKGH